MHLRKMIAACALALASMLVISSTTMADDFSAGSFSHPMGLLDKAACDDLAYCGVAADVTPATSIDVASMNAADLPAIMPASLMSKNCPEDPAWVSVEHADGSSSAERRPACSRRYDPGWRYT